MRSSDKYNHTEFRSLANRRQNGETVVFTNGCFDILHVGHVRYLQEARALGNILVVGLNSDDSTRRLKGEGRPIVPEKERKELLLALRSVDCVCLFDEETPFELIKQVRPEILVKGGDWPVEKIVGADFVQSYGGMVRSLSFAADHSTTDIIERIRAGR